MILTDEPSFDQHLETYIAAESTSCGSVRRAHITWHATRTDRHMNLQTIMSFRHETVVVAAVL